MIPIVIPSMGRSAHVYAKRAFPTDRVSVCVPKSEKAKYVEANPDVEVVAHPDDIVGMGQKRQWIYEKWGDVVMVDDDTVAVIHLEHGFGEKPHAISPDDAGALCDRLAREAKEFGAFLFGLGSSVNPQSYMAIRPFRTTGWVNGGFTGLLAGSKLTYHPQVACSEDYWISGLNAYHHRKVWVDTRFALKDVSGAGTMRTAGGMAVVRNTEQLEREAAILKEHFGNAIKAKAKLSYTSNMHEHQVSFSVPW